MSAQDNGPKNPLAKDLTWRFETVRTMSGTQFELYVAGLLRAMRHNTRVLGGSGDQGVDLIVDYFGERVAVQCKNYAKPVGNKPVQEVFAGAKLFDSASIRAWIGEVDKAASPHSPSESFPPTYPTSELRNQDSESYHTLLDDYEMELARLERVREQTTNPYGDDRSTNANTVQILIDTQARIFDIRKQLDAFEKLGTGTLEQKQRHAQLKARQEKAAQEARKGSHGVGWLSRRRRPRVEEPWAVGCCAGPVFLFFAAVIVLSAALFNALIFGGGLGEGMVYGLIVVGGIVWLLYAVGKRS